MNITFEPTNLDGDTDTNTALRSLQYLNLVVDSGGAYGGSVAGWVRPEVAKLVKAAPEMLEACIAAEKAYRRAAGEYPDDEIKALQMMRAAIAKATTKSHELGCSYVQNLHRTN